MPRVGNSKSKLKLDTEDKLWIKSCVNGKGLNIAFCFQGGFSKYNHDTFLSDCDGWTIPAMSA